MNFHIMAIVVAVIDLGVVEMHLGELVALAAGFGDEAAAPASAISCVPDSPSAISCVEACDKLDAASASL